MSVSCGFFNSSNKDRLYDARQFSSIFDGVINDGVYMGYGGHFAVTAMSTPSLSVNLASGRAWFNHTWTLNDSTMTMTFDSTLGGRCDAIVLQVDASDTVRANKIYIKKGTEGSPATKPSMTNTGDVHEYPLCYVTIPTTNVIAQSAIENRIGTSDAPFVTGIIETIDASTLITQWQSEFNEWKAGIVSWEESQEAAYSDWVTAKEGEYDTWVAAKEAEYEEWLDEFEAWYAGWQTDQTDYFLAWFDRMKGQLSEDAAGHLQLEIDDLKPLFDGFENGTTVFNSDGTITTTYSDRKKHTVFNADGSITETLRTLQDTVYLTKTTTFNPDGSITETVV